MAPPILKGEAWGLCRGRVQDGRAASRHNRHGVTSESVPHQAVPAQMVRMNGGGWKPAALTAIHCSSLNKQRPWIHQ